MDDGGPAFPRPLGHGVTGQVNSEAQDGMTLRDWFAGEALMGMHARDTFDVGQDTPEKRAKLAYLDADAMLNERKRKE